MGRGLESFLTGVLEGANQGLQARQQRQERLAVARVKAGQAQLVGETPSPLRQLFGGAKPALGEFDAGGLRYRTVTPDMQQAELERLRQSFGDHADVTFSRHTPFGTVTVRPAKPPRPLSPRDQLFSDIRQQVQAGQAADVQLGVMPTDLPTVATVPASVFRSPDTMERLAEAAPRAASLADTQRAQLRTARQPYEQARTAANANVQRLRQVGEMTGMIRQPDTQRTNEFRQSLQNAQAALAKGAALADVRARLFDAYPDKNQAIDTFLRAVINQK